MPTAGAALTGSPIVSMLIALTDATIVAAIAVLNIFYFTLVYYISIVFIFLSMFLIRKITVFCNVVNVYLKFVAN